MTGLEGARAIGLGHWAVLQREGALACLGLGSCVAVILDDRDARVGGLAHVVLPTASLSRDQSNPARFAETAVPMLIGELVRAGAVRGRLRARLVGGASLFGALTPPGTVQIGQRNVSACRTALSTAGIDVVGAAVGGEVGRSVWYAVHSGTVTVRSVGHAPEQI
jgi:chemotaxis protein CheD